MKYIESILSIFVLIFLFNGAKSQQSKQQLEQTAAQLQQILNDTIEVMKNHPRLTENDLRVINQQDASLKLLVIQLREATAPPQLQQIEQRLAQIETAVQQEIGRLQFIIASETPRTPPPPIDKTQLEQRAAELEKLLEEALIVLREHLKDNELELLTLEGQDLELKVVVEQLETAINPIQVAGIEGRLIQLENQVQNEINRLNEIIRRGATATPNASTVSSSTNSPVQTTTQSAPSSTRAIPVTNQPPSTANVAGVATSTENLDILLLILLNRATELEEEVQADLEKLSTAKQEEVKKELQHLRTLITQLTSADEIDIKQIEVAVNESEKRLNDLLKN